MSPLEVVEDVQTVDYGLPFTGYNGAIERDRISRHELAVDSLDWQIDPNEGKLVRRAGITNDPADTGGLGGTAGTLESNITTANGFAMRGIQIEQLRFSPIAAAFGNPTTHMVLYCDEDNVTESYAQLYYYNAEAATNIVLALSGATYPFAAAAGIQPWAYLGGNRMGIDAVPNDLASQTARARHMAGGRSIIDVGNWVYMAAFGNPLNNTNLTYPHAWNKGNQNFAPGSGITHERQVPMGHVPPMWMPRIGLGAVGTKGSESWTDNDVFFISVAYIWEDGSWSMPVMPRLPNVWIGTTIGNEISFTNGLGGYGLVSLGAYAAAPAKYDYIVWSGIPVPPPGVKFVVLLRSVKTTKTNAGPPEVFPMPDADPFNMGIVALLAPGVTTYNDPAGGNLETVDPNLFYKDQTWCPRTRYLFQFDQRVAALYVREHPAAMLVTFRGTGGTNDEHNVTDVASGSIAAGAVRGQIRLSGGFLDLIRHDNAGAASATRRYPVANYASIQELVDAINSQVPAGGGSANDNATDRWHAELVPGANGEAPTSALATMTGSFGDVTVATGAGGVYPLAVLDYQRTFGAAQPGLVMFTSAYLDALPVAKDTLLFTPGGPTHAPNAARSWRVVNNRKAPAGSGIGMGGVPLLDGALVGFSERMAIMRNIRDGKTGADEDYRLEELPGSSGMIAPSMGHGRGFGVYLTRRGVVAGSAEGEILLPGLYNPSRRTGPLAYEIERCEKATAADTFDHRFQCFVSENQIWISYRSSSASATYPDVYQVLDFSPGKNKTGLRALIDDRREIDGRPNPGYGEPFGWSAPFKPKDGVNSFSAMGKVERTDQRMLIGTRERNGLQGRVDQFDYGTTDAGTRVAGYDDGSVIAPVAYFKTDRPSGPNYLHTAEQVYAKWKKNGAGMTLSHARQRDAHTTNPAYFVATALATTGVLPWTEDWFDLTLPERAQAEVCEWKLNDDGAVDGTLDGRPEFWGATMRFGLAPRLQ